LVLCNDTKVSRLDKGTLYTIGDPTETALVDYAAAKGLYKDMLDELIPRAAEIPFDSERKLMTAINRLNDKLRVITKGAPDVLLEKCSRVLSDGKVKTLTLKQERAINEANKNMASRHWLLGLKGRKAVTTAFATLGLIQLAHALTLRSESTSIFKLGLFSNKYLIGAISLAALLQVSVIIIPVFNDIFRVKQLDMVEWGIILFASISIIPLVELYKLIKNIVFKKE